MMKQDLKRTDDAFFRKLIAGLVLMILLEGGSFVYYYGKLVGRVDVIERDVAELKGMSETIYSMDKSLYLLNSKADYLTNRLDKNAKIIEHMKSEQDKRETTVREAGKHIKDRRLHQKGH